MTPSTERDAEQLLHELLVETAAAHGAYETEQLGGVYDEAWPGWYARHLAEALAARGIRFESTRTDAPAQAAAAEGAEA